MNEYRLMSSAAEEIDTVVTKYKGRHGELLSILEQIQLLNEHKFLSEEALNRVALRTRVPLSRIYNVVTFYSFFNLKPQGKHMVTVCRGTACHTKGSRTLLSDLGLILNCSKALEDGEAVFTTQDNQFTISTVACFGQCALAPAISIDGIMYSTVTTAKLQKLLKKISNGREKS